MRILNHLLLLICFAISINTFKHTLLRRCHDEMDKMINFYHKGDTSHAFSVALKVLFAVETLHKDLEMPAAKAEAV